MSLSEVAKPYYSPSDIVSVMQGCGSRAEMEKLNSRRTVIRSAGGGCRFSVDLYGPKDAQDRINSIRIYSLFSQPVTLEKANAWNSEKRFVKAYADKDGELCLELDAVINFVPPAAIKEILEWWEYFLGKVDEL